ncbi:LLM class flavin-dependent oxidoreductase [Streptomyces sp. RGM 3693]|uniref:LLM class flavin-dependent oxidoreductase n=1 Tax=Streptomyces sp. RGM 3693 TaxID=3413284 RepID=UPI003D2C4F5F
MKYGISFLPDCRCSQRSATEYLDDALALSCLAEELGFDYVKMTEHYLQEYGGYSPHPLTFLAAVAARTRSIRLMTGGIQASFHHPVQIAAQAAQVDVLSHGRLDVGFARAFLPYEFDTFGVPMEGSRQRYKQTVEAVLRLWTEKDVSESSEFFQYSGVNSLPSVTQMPHPPTWVAGLMSPETFSWAGDRGLNLLMASPPRAEELPKARENVELYKSRFQVASEVGGGSPRVAISIPLMIGETDADAVDRALPRLRAHWQVFGEAAESLLHSHSSDYAKYPQAVKKIKEMSDDDLIETAIVGSPETVTERIVEFRRALSVDTFLWHIDYGGQAFNDMAGNLRRFRENVLPRLPK